MLMLQSRSPKRGLEVSRSNKKVVGNSYPAAYSE